MTRPRASHREGADMLESWVIRTGPKRRDQIIEHFGWDTDRLSVVMRVAGHRGVLGKARLERQIWWMPAELVPIFKAEVKAAQKEKNKARYHALRASGVLTGYNRLADPPEWEIERRYVKAGTVPPPETRAPNSVFAWGAAA